MNNDCIAVIMKRKLFSKVLGAMVQDLGSIHIVVIDCEITNQLFAAKTMKNSLLIDVDTERKDPIRITKTEDTVNKVNDEESAKKMVLEDMTTLCNALGTLIQLANDSGYIDSKVSANMCVNYLNDNFLDKK